MQTRTRLAMRVGSSIWSALLLFLECTAMLQQGNGTSRTFEGPHPLVEVVGKGETCGPDGLERGRVCGDNLCCFSKDRLCASDKISCSAMECLPLYSTGCNLQGTINNDLLPSPSRTYNISINGTHTPNSNGTIPRELFPPLDYLVTLPRPLIGPIPYAEVITSCTVPGSLALTFDDGPWRYTSDLLDLLEREDVRATFFVCGGNMNNEQLTWYGHPRLLRRMLADGHQIGTHTYSHADLATLDAHQTFAELFLNEQALVGVLGLLPTYFRPPYLSWANVTLEVMAELGYHVVSVDLDTMDWAGDYREAKRIFEHELDENDSNLSGKLVLAHNIRLRTVYELVEFMIGEAKRRGYQLVTVGECLGDDPKNWYRNPYDGRSWIESPAITSSLKKQAPHFSEQ